MRYDKQSNDDKIVINEYLQYIRSYLWNIKDSLKTSGEWNIYLTMKMNFL